MQQKPLVLILVVVLVVGAVAAWQFAPKNPSDQPRSVKVGLVAPLDLPEGQDMLNGARLAVQEINDAGGIYIDDWKTKVNLALIVADTKDDASANAIKALTYATETDQVDLLIGGSSDQGTLDSQIIAIDNKVPYIITGAQTSLVTTRGPQGNYSGLPAHSPQTNSDGQGMSYMFHYGTSTSQYARSAVEYFAQEIKPLVAPDRNLRLAVLYTEDAFGLGVLQATKFWIGNESLPIDIVLDRSYLEYSNDLEADLAAVAAVNPDAVLVADNVNGAKVLERSKQAGGLEAVFMVVGADQNALIANEQLLVSSLSLSDAAAYLPAIRNYTQKYSQTYRATPGTGGAYTYDAVYIVKDAVERAGTADKAKVRDALENTDLPQSMTLTVNGRVQFSRGLNYHEIEAVTVVRQLLWNSTADRSEVQIVWPSTAP